MELYIGNTVERSRSEAIAAREFLSTQLPETETALKAAEERLREFREAEGVVDISEEARRAVEALSEFDLLLAQSEGRLADVTSRTAQLEQQLGMSVDRALVVSNVSQAPGIQSVLSVLQEVETQLALNLNRFQANNPSVAALQGQVTALQGLLARRIQEVAGTSEIGLDDLQTGDLERRLIGELAELEIERLGLLDNVATLRQNRDAIVERASNLPNLGQQQQEIEREVRVLQTSFEGLLARQQDLLIAGNQGIVNASILELATTPSSPTKDRGAILLLMAGVVFGGIGAIAVIFLKEIADPALKSAKGVREVFGQYPLLGTIPSFTRARKGRPASSPLILPLRDVPYSPLSEMYRNIQATLELQQMDRSRISRVTIASSVPGEGKSTLSANLAMAVAELGRSVLLIDADLRSPTQAKLWELPSGPGLVEVLSQVNRLSHTLHNVRPGLHVLTAGAQTVNPTGLLQSRAFAAFLAQASKRYDLVVIDTPPLAVAADALIAGHLCDGTILVARPGKVDHRSAKGARVALKRSGQRVFGLILNAIDPARSTDNSFDKLQRYYTNSEYSPQRVPDSTNGRKTVRSAAVSSSAPQSSVAESPPVTPTSRR